MCKLQHHKTNQKLLHLHVHHLHPGIKLNSQYLYPEIPRLLFTNNVPLDILPPRPATLNLPPYTPILTLLTDPTFILPLFICLALQPIFYQLVIYCFPQRFATPKQRSWILTALSSFVMTAASIPYLVDFFMHSGALDTAPCMMWTRTAKALCAFFVSYCLGDLIVGHLLYPTEMNPWSGYFHHTLYTFMVTNLVQRGLPSAFVIFGVLEAPTFLMSLGAIHKPLRNDKLFGAVFFITRLAFHVYLTIHVAVAAFPWTAVFMYPASVLPLHVMWFNGWVKQQRRLRLKAKLTSPEVPATNPVTPPPSLLSRSETYRKAMALKERFLTRHKRPQRPLAASVASTAVDMGRRMSVGHMKSGIEIGEVVAAAGKMKTTGVVMA
ncbi:hypothetical protein BC829DRAFT_413662 [Chytridium lagenaria]|nr:hypothetical protein BC829DRAFT_413662 [Chytridium lagenaria]